MPVSPYLDMDRWYSNAARARMLQWILNPPQALPAPYPTEHLGRGENYSLLIELVRQLGPFGFCRVSNAPTRRPKTTCRWGVSIYHLAIPQRRPDCLSLIPRRGAVGTARSERDALRACAIEAERLRYVNWGRGVVGIKINDRMSRMLLTRIGTTIGVIPY